MHRLPDHPDAGERRLLIVAYYFPPVKVVGAVRLRHFFRAARAHFAKIAVVTTRNRRLMAKDEALQVEPDIFTEVPTLDLRRLTLRRSKGKSPQLTVHRKQSRWYRTLRQLADSFPFNLLLDDGGLLYIWRGYRAACRLVEAEKLTHVFSSFRPYADHLIAWLLKRRYPHLYWIADFRDLHVDPALGNVLWPAHQLRWNRFLLRKADRLTTVSEGLAQHLRRLHPDVKVLYNGLEQLPEAVRIRPDPDRFTLVYTGSLFQDRRDPRPLLAAIRSLLREGVLTPENFGIIYAGLDTAQWFAWILEYGLESVFKSQGLVAREEALRLQQRAHLNLLLTYTSADLTGNLTGKIFEYLAAGPPVLALVKGPPDPELEALFRELEAGAVIYHGPEAETLLRGYLLACFEAFKREQGYVLGGEDPGDVVGGNLPVRQAGTNHGQEPAYPAGRHQPRPDQLRLAKLAAYTWPVMIREVIDD